MLDDKTGPDDIKGTPKFLPLGPGLEADGARGQGFLCVGKYAACQSQGSEHGTSCLSMCLSLLSPSSNPGLPDSRLHFVSTVADVAGSS
jgi:hypothetical protein